MKHASAVAAEAKASLIQLIKNHSKNIEIAAIWNIFAYKSWFLKFFKKRKGMRYIFLIMKQKGRLKNFVNISIGYRSMNGRYVSIGPKKAISLDLYSMSPARLTHWIRPHCLTSSFLPKISWVVQSCTQWLLQNGCFCQQHQVQILLSNLQMTFSE